ncbi:MULTISPECIES: alpha/beta fold hydrolase [unclassified Psychrobacter]|uniref:alpha/beta fold hydrolase n=1 Tax=unclassified Psychrobacter TaxID=196806 RepID=UPI0018F5414F|nr:MULTISPECIES: alpha/beta hydrolase [unclassified Psychrobacter]
MTHFDKQYDSVSDIEFIQNDTQGSETTVFLHGISSGCASWTNQMAFFAGKSPALAWNAPGYGKSGQMTQQVPTARDYSRRLHCLLVARNIKHITLVGHSLGALIAAGFAAEYPEIVNRLILVNPAQGYGEFEEVKQDEVAKMRPALLKQLGGAEMARRRSSVLLFHANDDNVALLESIMTQITLTGFEKSSRLLAHDSIHHYLAKIDKPIDLIYGTEDGITPPKIMFEIAKRHQHISLHAIEDASHLSYLDQPARFNQVLLSIIQGDDL